MTQIIRREILELFLNPRYLSAFLVSAALVIISIFNGFAAYQQDLEDAISAERYSMREAEKTESYKYIDLDVIRRPNILGIFDSGLSANIGRSAELSNNDSTPPEITDSRNEENPLYAMVTRLDLTNTVIFVLSLFAILFSHGMISGERELGTLKLIAANPIRRTSIYFGKIIGGSIPIIVLLAVPAMFGVLLVSVLGDFSFTGGQWLKLSMMLVQYILFLLTVFLAGAALSALTRSSFMSLLACLVFWVAVVAIIPSMGVQTAAVTHPTMSPVELQKEVRATQREFSRKMFRDIANDLNERKIPMREFGKFFREVWSGHEVVANKNRLERNRVLYDDFFRRRDAMMEAAMNYSRLSPAACLQHSVNALSGNGPSLLNRFQEDLETYNKELDSYSKEMVALNADEEKSKTDGSYGVRMENDERGFMKFASVIGLDQGRVDLSAMPRIQLTESDAMEAFTAAQVDMALLVFYALLFFAIGYVALLRYDVR